MKEEDDWIERRIVTGLVVSTEYLQLVHPIWNPSLLESSTARTLADWCLEYYRTYQRAPAADVQGIYTVKLKEGLPRDQAEKIELVLQSLSSEHEHSQFNVQYLLDQTYRYLQRQHILHFVDELRGELTSGSLSEAEKLISGYTPITMGNGIGIDPFASPVLVRQAFEDGQHPLIKFGKALGRLWNSQMTRDAFVALMGMEKSGKSWWLMEIAMRAMACGCNVAFFQAGDMSERQMIKRLCIYLTKRSDQKRYCENIYMPVIDCFNNQSGTCRNRQREPNNGHSVLSASNLGGLTFDDLVRAYREYGDHRPCHNCDNEPGRGSIWMRRMPDVEPLDARQAWKHIERWKRHNKKRFKLATYSNETLSVQEINSLLGTWEKQDNFVPDVVVIDYADILSPDPDAKNMDYRHQQNKIWQRLRRLSQERHCLVLTATQAAASAYDRNSSLRMSDFSETKTKYAHVTAMYGLNQTAEEKRIGIMRINEIVVREGDFDRTSEVKVLQRLQTGRPFLGSFR